MKETITITTERLQELMELTIAKTRAIDGQDAPDTVVNNSHVVIHNHYGDVYEEDHSLPAVPEKTPKQTADKTQKTVYIRQAVMNLMVEVESLMKSLEKRDPGCFTTNAKYAQEGLAPKFVELSQALKGDTSIQKVQNAYLMTTIQIVLASSLSGVFLGEDKSS